jgi:hypothetical protein
MNKIEYKKTITYQITPIELQHILADYFKINSTKIQYIIAKEISNLNTINFNTDLNLIEMEVKK